MPAAAPPPPESPQVSITSLLTADLAAVWEHASTPEGINYEMRPWMRMTVPAGALNMTADQVVLGERLFRSWVLLFGLIPFDYDDLTLVELDEGRRFLERSKMLSASVWQHERTIEPAGEGLVRVTDTVTWVPRMKLATQVHQRIVAAFFAHRHRRMLKRFTTA